MRTGTFCLQGVFAVWRGWLRTSGISCAQQLGLVPGQAQGWQGLSKGCVCSVSTGQLCVYMELQMAAWRDGRGAEMSSWITGGHQVPEFGWSLSLDKPGTVPCGFLTPSLLSSPTQAGALKVGLSSESLEVHSRAQVVLLALSWCLHMGWVSPVAANLPLAPSSRPSVVTQCPWQQGWLQGEPRGAACCCGSRNRREVRAAPCLVSSGPLHGTELCCWMRSPGQHWQVLSSRG